MRYSVTIVTNASPDRFDMVKKTPAGSTRETVMPLSVAYPQEVYLCHMLPLRSPQDDGSLWPPSIPVENRYGTSLGTIAALWGRNIGSERLAKMR